MTRSPYPTAMGLLLAAALASPVGISIGVSAQGRATAAAPTYHVVPLWPAPFPDDSWVLGSITGVAVDGQNHVWVAQRGFDSLESNEKGRALVPTPSSTVCCVPAPFILEFDASGQLLSSWGGPSQGYRWPQATGGIAVDTKGNVWITAAGLDPAPPGSARGRGAGVAGEVIEGREGGRSAAAVLVDAHVLKFSHDGRYLLTIGTPGKVEDADSHTTLNRPAAVAYDAAVNEVFVADSGNHRIIVFDADTGAYKRHWFAYGEKAAPPPAGAYDPAAPAAKSFRDVTCVEISRDGKVYVCDRTSNRIQVFDKDGRFLQEMVIAKETRGATVALAAGATAVISAHGSVWDLAFSSDPQQRYVFVADGVNKKIRILSRDTLAEVGSFGSGGRYPGQFLAVDSVATDSQGDVYTGETHHGKRVQKFVPGR